MSYKRTLTALIGLMIFQVSYGLELNGVASYQQLRKEFYIAALYLEKTTTQPEDIINSNTSKRMALKVTTKRWSPRRWSLQWQNDIAINNSFAQDSALTNQLMLFTGFLEKKLVSGDEIIIDYVATVGTNISINNVKIIETNTAQLFNYLLNVWIGKLPPSGEFKARILGQQDEQRQALLDSYNSVNYDDSRSKLIASWVQGRKDAIAAEEKRKQDEIKQLANAKKEQANRLAQQEKKKTYVAPKIIAKKKVITKQKKIASIKPAKSGSKSKKVLKAENQYYNDLYQWELIREIRNAVEYPEWAKKFGQKGNVKLNFVVNRKAEVSNVSGSNEEVSVLLVSELHRAILAVVPFVLPPDALPGKQWNMSVQYSFNPKSEKQVYNKKPKKPASLMAASKITRAEYTKQLSSYIDDVKIMVNEHIQQYSRAQQFSRKKGLVKIEITVNSNGEVTATKDIQLSNHDTLNEQVRFAIEETQPFPAIPEALRLNSTRITIEQRFK